MQLKNHLEGACFSAQSLRSGISPVAVPNRKSPPRDPIALEGLRRLLPEPTPSPRLWAASPGATPVRLCEHTMRVPTDPSEPELSTWLRIGTFYLAPTVMRLAQRYRVGTSLLELTKVRVPCATLDIYGPRIKKAIFDNLVKNGDASTPVWGLSGFYARVIEPGEICQGDSIALESGTADAVSVRR